MAAALVVASDKPRGSLIEYACFRIEMTASAVAGLRAGQSARSHPDLRARAVCVAKIFDPGLVAAVVGIERKDGEEQVLRCGH
jgi:hypothetical protein